VKIEKSGVVVAAASVVSAKKMVAAYQSASRRVAQAHSRKTRGAERSRAIAAVMALLRRSYLSRRASPALRYHALPHHRAASKR
jgi:hypothetical protein